VRPLLAPCRFIRPHACPTSPGSVPKPRTKPWRGDRPLGDLFSHHIGSSVHACPTSMGLGSHGVGLGQVVY